MNIETNELSQSEHIPVTDGDQQNCVSTPKVPSLIPSYPLPPTFFAKLLYSPDF